MQKKCYRSSCKQYANEDDHFVDLLYKVVEFNFTLFFIHSLTT